MKKNLLALTTALLVLCWPAQLLAQAAPVTFGTTSTIPVFSVNGKGIITSASTVTFAVIDDPPSSTISPGVKQSGGSSTWAVLMEAWLDYLDTLALVAGGGNDTSVVWSFFLATVAGATSGSLKILAIYAVPVP